MTRKKMPQGIDPVAERKQERQAVRTFRKAAELVHEEHEEAWKNGNHQNQWIATLILPSNSATNALVVNLARHGSHKHLQRRANRISATLVDEHSENHLSLLMSNALARLLETDSTRRSVEDYERTFDDYIAFAGGIRIEDRFDIPTGVLNADYMVETTRSTSSSSLSRSTITPRLLRRTATSRSSSNRVRSATRFAYRRPKSGSSGTALVFRSGIISIANSVPMSRASSTRQRDS